MLMLDATEANLGTLTTPRHSRVKSRGDAELFKLEEKLADAHAAWLTAVDRQAEADRTYYRIRSLGVTGVKDDQPGRRVEAAARRAAGIRVAERAVEQAENRMKRVVRSMLAVRTTSVAGMHCKMRILALGIAAAVMRSVEADLRAMGLLTAG